MTSSGSPGRGRDWDEIAGLDAMWAILSEPDKRHRRWDPAAFFETGRTEIDGVLAQAAEWGLPLRRDRALDFGCGVGRLSRALARDFGAVVGVDISQVMVDQARALNEDVPACAFEVLPERGLAGYPSASFDCVYSRLVLQHIPDRRLTEMHVREFVRVLAAGGVLVFQLPSRIPARRRLQVRPALYRALRALGVGHDLLIERLHLHPIRMHAVPESDVTGLIAAAGGTILRVDRALAGTTGIEDRTYWVTR